MDRPATVVGGEMDAVLRRRAAGRERLRARDGRGSDRLYVAYLLLLVSAPVVYLVINALLGTERMPQAAIQILHGRLAIAGPLALLAASVAVLRTAVWAGPVLVSQADIAFLLTLPVPRVAVLGPLLRRSMQFGSAGGGLAGALVAVPYFLTVGLPGDPVVVVGVALGGALVGTLWGVLLVAGSWTVERSPSLARQLSRASGPVLVALVALIAWVAMAPSTHFSTTATFLTTDAARWLGLLLITGLSGVAARAARYAERTAGDIPLEELQWRSSTSRQMTAAALYFVDFRAASQARDRAIRRLVGRSRRRLPIPRRPALLVPWIGATILLRQPRRLAQALLWILTAPWLFGVEQWGGLLASLAGYAAAGLLIEPLRIELEQRFGARMLPPSLRSLGLRHLVTPVVALWLLGMLGGLLFTLVTGTSAETVAPATLLLASVGLVLSAAVAASGPPPDPDLLFYGEAGVGFLLGQLTRGPQLALAVVGVPLTLAVELGTGMGGQIIVLVATTWTAVAGATLAWLIRRRLHRFHA